MTQWMQGSGRGREQQGASGGSGVGSLAGSRGTGRCGGLAELAVPCNTHGAVSGGLYTADVTSERLNIQGI